MRHLTYAKISPQHPGGAASLVSRLRNMGRSTTLLSTSKRTSILLKWSTSVIPLTYRVMFHTMSTTSPFHLLKSSRSHNLEPCLSHYLRTKVSHLGVKAFLLKLMILSSMMLFL
jgi:hypothetical protein